MGRRAPPPDGLLRAEPFHLDFDTLTDKELAALAAAGNEGAFAELLRRNLSTTMGHLYGIN